MWAPVYVWTEPSGNLTRARCLIKVSNHMIHELHLTPNTDNINSIYDMDASVLVQMSTESPQTTCMHCYDFKHIQMPCTYR